MFFFVLLQHAGRSWCYWVKNTQKIFQKIIGWIRWWNFILVYIGLFIYKIIEDFLAGFNRYIVSQNRFIAIIDFNFYKLELVCLTYLSQRLCFLFCVCFYPGWLVGFKNLSRCKTNRKKNKALWPFCSATIFICLK